MRGISLQLRLPNRSFLGELLKKKKKGKLNIILNSRGVNFLRILTCKF